jgi:hypothetical protein
MVVRSATDGVTICRHAPVRADRCGEVGDLDNRLGAGAVPQQKLIDLLHQCGMVASRPCGALSFGA